MSEWNPRDYASWARILGLAPVPMFGAARAGEIPGTHAMMLDGDSGSFVWSMASQRATIDAPTANRWAWSSNVRWSVALASDASEALARRWDQPDEEVSWKIRNERDVRKLFESFHDLPKPSGQSVIERGLNTFWAIRKAVEKKGGTELDVALAFNTILAWVARDSSSGQSDTHFAQAADALYKSGDLGFSGDAISKPLRSYPVGALASLLREGGNSSAYLLDADLLIRHAIGTLNQEAHKQLLEPAAPDRQQELPFAESEMLLAGRDRLRGPAPSYIHHTPPSLARALIEVSLSVIKWPDSGPLHILDPSCGSGVFLIEALRELTRQKQSNEVEVRGIDKSNIAVAMSDFCVRHAVSGMVDNQRYSFQIDRQDSLEIKNWGSPNLVLMNPPFLIWEQLSATEKASVRASLGPAHRDRPDMAFAFIFRALESLAPGGVVASVVPASFLESRSAEDIRSHITHSGEFQVHLIGQFRDFGYFDATLQPAFIVVSRSEQYGPVRILVAEEKNGDEALRLLRRIPWHENAIEEGIELHNVSKHDLPVERWTPQPRQALEFIELIKENTFTTVGDFFIPRLGVRVGDRDVLLVTPDDLSKLCTTKSEKRYFRPIADRISDGRIEPTDYVFYPYGTDGALLLTTESQLREALPTFYQQRLLPAKSSLKKRGSLHHRNWWEVSEPVATWLAAHTPRIVSQEFSRAGNFAVDTTGEYAVCGGLGWCWNRGTVDLKTLLAYLAILNSEFFDKVLSCYCPRTRGKQYKVRRNFVERVPLPALDDAEVRRGLESIGRAITNGKTYDHQTREALAKKAYGVSQAGKPLKIEQNANARLERRFKDLADQWEAATGVYSRTEQKLRHPLYREIIALGSGLVPLLLKEMRDSPGHWSDALRELTGANPVPKKADTLKAIAKAWVSWGREHGHDI